MLLHQVAEGIPPLGAVREVLDALLGPVDETDVLWLVRQAILRTVSFARTDALELARMIPVLRPAVVNGLEAEIGFAESEHPVLQVAGITVGAAAGVGGRRKVGQEDLFDAAYSFSRGSKRQPSR